MISNSTLSTRRLAVLVVGFCTTWSSLALALFCGGPALRFIWGVPTGFGEDYTTWQNVAQAVLAQALFLIPAFALCGLVLRKLWASRPGWRSALLIANPFNVFAGYWFYYKAFYTGQNLHLELLYFRLSGAIFWSFMSLVVLAPVALAGLRFHNRSANPKTG